MATLAADTQDAVAELYRDLIDAATTAGNAVFRTSADAEIATCELSDPCTGSASSGVITFSSITSDTNATGGTIDYVGFEDGDANEVLRASIAVDSSEELQIGNLTISAGSTVGISSLTLTQTAT